MGELRQDTRCYGVDLLKTLSMFMVVILHLLGHGGILWGSAQVGTVQYNAAWILECFALCAVNCFAMASGYLMVGKRVKYRKLLPMWLTVFFYVLLFLVVGNWILPGSVTASDWWNLLPVTSGKYWYFTAYVGLYLLLPFVNKGMETLSEKSFKLLLLVGFVLSSGIFLFSVEKDVFKLAQGYSVWWLLYLYLLGAGIKKYGLFAKIPCWAAGLGYVASALLTFGGKWASYQLTHAKNPAISAFFGRFGDTRFEQYLSPTLVAAAVFLLLFCVKLKLPRFTHKPLKWLSPLIFQVYIIHENPWVKYNFIQGKTAYLAQGSTLKMLVCILLGAVLIFVACISLDTARYWLFKLVRLATTAVGPRRVKRH